ncbi:PRC-barrel domain-containing protein [Patulibacter sp. NPDC049589]|uniref:PRC-barrel domain-containing protein n=1 Tax=Patulibacter sp. NPDC049589 TaxID=3154731 RepID=UPI003421628F
MPHLHEVEELQGRQVVDSGGHKIGKIDEIFLGEASGEPEWALVNTGLFGLRSSFVLITDADLADGDVTVPFDKATVKDAPNIHPDGALSPDEEARLFEHYGRTDYGAAPAGDAISAAAPSADGELPERWGPEGPTGRSETEDPVPPDGGPPPASGDAPAPAGLPHIQGDGSSDDVPKPPGAPDGVEQPVADVPKPAGAPDTSHAREHGLGATEIPTGGAKATPEHGPVAPASAQDEVEAPESPDAGGPSTASSGIYRSRMRRYVAAEDADRGPVPGDSGKQRDDL